MKFIFPKGLTHRFFTLGLFLVVIPITIIFVLAIYLSQNVLQNQADENTLQGARTTANQTQQLFLSQINMLETIVGNYTGEEDFDNFIERIETAYLKDPFFIDIAFINQDGERENKERRSTLGNSSASMEQSVYEEMLWRNSSFVTTRKAEDESSLGVYIAVPVPEPAAPELEGAVIARTNMFYLNRLLQNSRIGEEGRTLLVTNEGDIFVDTAEASGDAPLQSLTGAGFLNDMQRGRIGVYRGEAFGEEVLAGYYPVDRLPLYSVAIQPMEEANAPIGTLSAVLTFGWLVILATGLILLTVSIRWIVKPVKELTDQAADYAKGEGWHLNILKEKDEIFTLGTAMKHMAESLQEKERFLQLILESFPYGVITTGTDGNVTSMNKAGARLFAGRREDFVDKSITVLPSKGLREHLLRYRKGNGKFSDTEEEIHYVNKDGKSLTLKAASSPLLDENGKMIGVLTTFWDYTELKKLHQHLHRSEHLAAIGQMTAGLAHEVKNPLGTIQMASDVVEAEFNDLAKKRDIKGPGPSMIKEAITDIQTEAQRLNELVTRFLKMSRHHKAEEQNVDIGKLVHEVSRLLSHQMKRENINLELDLPEKPLYVLGDRNQLVQAFLNIFLNSLEAMKNKEDGLLSVSVRESGRNIQVIVDDNGIGIPDAKINRIFNPFFSTKHEGSGLGLSITHDIIQDHNGSIEVASQAGEGTTCFVYLPESIETEKVM
ncbi:ATP-binding protein [Evansella sp. LMS18]|uniref:ATP-binding protein n=1 Tax=Evansella sp. LMS18 TaxID=2924033 RepID=UPI0020D0B55C|nr:ATP-binding protein [Evansella sp. LMS18]UTR11828.1 ATP-binding protein [Evansella sp. LMS18]